MATTTAIAYRRARALNLADNVSRALAAEFNLEPAPTYTVRDRELAQVVLIERLAATLGQVAVATGTIKAEDLEAMADVNYGQTTPEGNGAAQPNEDGLDPSMPEGAKEPTKGQQSEADSDLNKLTKADLLKRAEGIEGVTADNNKAEIIAKILEK